MAKATAEQYQAWFTHLYNSVNTKSIYVWGAQGQGYPTITESWIRGRETSDRNAERAIATWKKSINAGFEKTLKAYDCSGLGMAFLYNQHKILSNDMSANTMKGQCYRALKKSLRKGDWVFRTHGTGNEEACFKGHAYHIGYVVDDDLNVIEAKGRDYGCIIAPFDATYWNAYARPKFFQEYIEEGVTPTPTPVPTPTPSKTELFAKTLKNGSTGEDVMYLQEILNDWGYVPALVSDGIFGAKTETAVKVFQQANSITVDGIVGSTTETMLARYLDGKTETISLGRNLKLGDTGPDVYNAKLVGYSKFGWYNGKQPRLDSFGYETEEEVKKLQKEKDLVADGVIGEKTAKAMGINWTD